MAAIGGNTAGPGMRMTFDFYVSALLGSQHYLCSLSCLLCSGDAVVNVYINHEKKFAFVEMRSVEEASNAMALDGIIFEVFSSSLAS